MARGVRKSIDEKIAELKVKKENVSTKINELKKEAAEIDKQISELSKQKYEEELGELYEFRVFLLRMLRKSLVELRTCYLLR